MCQFKDFVRIYAFFYAHKVTQYLYFRFKSHHSQKIGKLGLHAVRSDSVQPTFMLGPSKIRETFVTIEFIKNRSNKSHA